MHRVRSNPTDYTTIALLLVGGGVGLAWWRRGKPNPLAQAADAVRSFPGSPAQQTVGEYIPIVSGLPPKGQNPLPDIGAGYDTIANSGLDPFHQAVATGYYINIILADQSNPAGAAQQAINFATQNQADFGTPVDPVGTSLFA